ncbi:MAG: glutamate-1-semialdehyde 2,1-aminomutase [Armatimonadota bacterium]
MTTNASEALFARATELIPGGVNSPVRAFRGVGGTPRFMERGAGSRVWDVDGNAYIDYIQSWGPLVMGHAHPKVVEAIATQAALGTSFGAPTKAENTLAELVIDMVPSIEMIRFVNSGTEATMSALRLARAVTGREKILKFSGCYHGHADMLLVAAGSGVATLGLPDSPGVTASTAAATLTVEYNDIDAVQEVFAKHGTEIAAVIVEPIAANMGFVLPKDHFLHKLQDICRANGALFILDEVMTGFRASLGGAQEAMGLDPDITCLGKVIGGGLPVGAYAGKREIMLNVAPAGKMYQAGTLSGNPLAMAAGLATLSLLRESGVFAGIAAQTAKLASGIKDVCTAAGVPVQTASMGTMFGCYFLKTSDGIIDSYAAAREHANPAFFGEVFHGMLERGVYLAPSQFEAGFVSASHSDDDIEATLSALDDTIS